jgi:hypothetical protein
MDWNQEINWSWDRILPDDPLGKAFLALAIIFLLVGLSYSGSTATVFEPFWQILFFIGVAFLIISWSVDATVRIKLMRSVFVLIAALALVSSMYMNFVCMKVVHGSWTVAGSGRGRFEECRGLSWNALISNL